MFDWHRYFCHVQTVMTQKQGEAFVRRLQFPPEIERQFQENYFRHILSSLRASFVIFFVVTLSSAVVSSKFGVGLSLANFNFARLPALVFLGLGAGYLLLFAASFWRGFKENWQLYAVLMTLVFFAAPDLVTDESLIKRLALLLVICVGVIWGRLQKLQFRWQVIQFAGILGITLLSDFVSPSGEGLTKTALVVGALVILSSVPVLWTLKSERGERAEFLANYLLGQERNEERQKREQTERMLHILSQAIGGIVHDLGNPLTSVQGGADTLRAFLEVDDLDKEMALEFTDMISEGAQMLNYLRLSLMEQTRVLEGKPVPVEPAPHSVSHLVKAGARFQKPRFSSGRTISFAGEDLTVAVDEMRFITVFMNLIGNALKYSDGEVRVSWKECGAHLLIAVQDRGLKGRGITREQAQKLFVPFGRLDTHSQIEGTGLGLLSVRKIAEAHGGEIYIEGTSDGDGTSASTPFSTAQGQYPSMLDEGFRTAFVTACPLEVSAKLRAIVQSDTVQ